MLLPSAEKRDAALLLDKIMFALKRAMKDKEGGGDGKTGVGAASLPTGGGEVMGPPSGLAGGGGSGVVTPNDLVAFAGVRKIYLYKAKPKAFNDYSGLIENFLNFKTNKI